VASFVDDVQQDAVQSATGAVTTMASGSTRSRGAGTATGTLEAGSSPGQMRSSSPLGGDIRCLSVPSST
jgi:hypothetical protein